MAAGKYSFVLEQGATFTRTINYKDSAGDPVDLSDYNARMQIRDNPGATTYYINLDSSISGSADGSGIQITPTSGSLVVTISAYSSSLFSFSEAWYDLEIYSGSGTAEYVTRLLEGKVKLSKNVTR